ncbi:MAG: hypothetical protein NT149_05000 [Candidatus Gottesmanbacteria bacterium]|nr:hypothetical protein [Candidatus Gottesmanbacteria bacterium]
MNQNILAKLRVNFLSPHTVIFIFLLLLGFELIVTSKSLSYDFYWDDIHLIRTYNISELQSVFVGQWDPDHIETAGYRPITTLFNHARAAVFGEHTLYHRLFILILLALSLTLFCKILFDCYSVPYVYSTLGCILTISARYNWFNLVWIADGIHVLVALLFVLSLWAITTFIQGGGRLAFVLCIGLVSVALLTREDALALVALFPIFGAYYVFLLSRLPVRKNFKNSLNRLGLITASLFILSMFYVFIHLHFVPETNILYLSGWVTHIRWSAFPMGSFFYAIWKIILIMIGITTVIMLPREKIYTVFFWILCLVIAATTGLVKVRTNLILLPIVFFSQLFVYILMEISKRNTIIKILGAVLLGTVIIVSARLNMVAQETMNPLSIERIVHTGILMTNPNASIPRERVIRMNAEEMKLGIKTDKDMQQLVDLLGYQSQLKIFPQTPLANGLFMPSILFYDQ